MQNAPTQFRRHLFAVLAIAVVTVACYSNTFHAPFYLDDYPSIIENTALRVPGNAALIWRQTRARFIGYLSFAGNHWVSGNSVTGYHITNVLIHIAAASAVYWLALLLLRWPAALPLPLAGSAWRIALFAGLVFGAHPVQTQAVTYIVQRFASLAALFYLLSVCCYLTARQAQAAGRRGGPVLAWFGGAVACASLAFATKETALTLPLTLVMTELTLIRRNGRLDWKYPAALLSATVLCAIAVKCLLQLPTRETTAISRSSYLFTEFRVILTYLRLLVIPVGQNLDYDYPVFHSLFQGPVLLGLGAIIALMAAAVRWAKKHPLLSYGICWFMITLSIESSFFPIRDVIFEHRLYLPMAGFAIAAAYGLHWLLHGQRERLRIVILAAVVVCLAVSTFTRNAVWSDPLRLWNDTVHKSPHKGRPYAGRGKAFDERGDRERAFADYRTAIGLDSTDATTWYNLGLYYETGNEDGNALYCYSRAIASNRGYARAYNNRAALLLALGKYRDAMGDLDSALRIDPRLSIPRYNMARCYYSLRRYDQALESIDASIALEPQYPWAHYWKGRIMMARRQPAISAFDRAVTLDPGNGRFHYYRALARAPGDSAARRADLAAAARLGFVSDRTDSALAVAP